jgi:hypothetical protein
MAILNPIYGLVLPFLCMFTLPLAIFAGITTTLAFSVLMFRVVLVYLDIALSFVPKYLMGGSGPTHRHGHRHRRALPASYGYREHEGQWSPTATSPNGSDGSGFVSGDSSPPRAPSLPLGFITTGHRSTVSSPTTTGRRSRRPSTAGGTTTPGKEGETNPFAFPSTTSSTNAIARDFEGVGGWRLGPDGDDESDWANINSRLELPLERRQGTNHHYRTSTSGSAGVQPVTPGEGSWLMMKSHNPQRKVAPGSPEREVGSGRRKSTSPNSSRARSSQGVVTFTRVEGGGRSDGYFPAAVSPKSSRKGS